MDTNQQWNNIAFTDRNNIPMEVRLSLYQLVNLSASNIREVIANGYLNTEFCHFLMAQYLVFAVMLMVGNMPRSVERRDIIANLKQLEERLFDYLQFRSQASTSNELWQDATPAVGTSDKQFEEAQESVQDSNRACNEMLENQPEVERIIEKPREEPTNKFDVNQELYETPPPQLTPMLPDLQLPAASSSAFLNSQYTSNSSEPPTPLNPLGFNPFSMYGCNSLYDQTRLMEASLSQNLQSVNLPETPVPPVAQIGGSWPMQNALQFSPLASVGLPLNTPFQYPYEYQVKPRRRPATKRRKTKTHVFSQTPYGSMGQVPGFFPGLMPGYSQVPPFGLYPSPQFGFVPPPQVPMTPQMWQYGMEFPGLMMDAATLNPMSLEISRGVKRPHPPGLAEPFEGSTKRQH